MLMSWSASLDIQMASALLSNGEMIGQAVFDSVSVTKRNGAQRFPAGTDL